MKNSASYTLLVGSVLAGAALLTSDVTIVATATAAASGIGVNWLSEAIPLFQIGQSPVGSPLAQAGSRALRKALADLEKQFRMSINPTSERKSFALLRETTNAVLEPAYPSGAAHLADLQATIASSLGELLYGHDAQEVAFLRQHLLAAVAVRFREELDSDDTVWRAFYGRLIDQLHTYAAQPNPPTDLTPILTRLMDQQQTLDALRHGDTALQQRLAALQQLIEHLEHNQPTDQAHTSFHTTQTTVGGNLNQAGGNLYQNSAHAQDGGTAVVNNISGNQTTIHNVTIHPLPTPPNKHELDQIATNTIGYIRKGNAREALKEGRMILSHQPDHPEASLACAVAEMMSTDIGRLSYETAASIEQLLINATKSISFESTAWYILGLWVYDYYVAGRRPQNSITYKDVKERISIRSLSMPDSDIWKRIRFSRQAQYEFGLE